MKDSWWEVKSQVLIICSNLLLYLVNDENIPLLRPSKSHNVEDLEESRNEFRRNMSEFKDDRGEADAVDNSIKEYFDKSASVPEQSPEELEQLREQREQNKTYLINIIYNIFQEYSSENILRIGKK